MLSMQILLYAVCTFKIQMYVCMYMYVCICMYVYEIYEYNKFTCLINCNVGAIPNTVDLFIDTLPGGRGT